MLEIFSGSGRVSSAFAARGWETLTIDLDTRCYADLHLDAMSLEAGTFRKLGWMPDVIWASPPCQKFSVLTISRNWKDGMPANEDTEKAVKLLEHTVALIAELSPRYYFIENPRGMMRKQKILNGRKRQKVTYCQYGDSIQKPTDIWTNCRIWQPRPACAAGDPCHERVPRGSNRGLLKRSSKQGSIARAVIPFELAEEIADACTPQKQLVSSISVGGVL